MLVQQRAVAIATYTALLLFWRRTAEGGLKVQHQTWYDSRDDDDDELLW